LRVGINNEVDAPLLRVALFGFIGKVLDNFTERQAIPAFVQANVIELAGDDLPAAPGKDEIGSSIAVGDREKVTLRGCSPGLFELDEAPPRSDVPGADRLIVTGLVHQIQIIISGLVAWIQSAGLLQLEFGFIHFAHFVKDAAILNERAGLDLLLLDFLHMRLRAFAGNLAGLLAKEFVIVISESQGLGIGGIDA